MSFDAPLRRGPHWRATRLLASLAAFVALAGQPATAVAQTTVSPLDSGRTARATSKVPSPHGTLFTKRDAWIAAGFAGATAALFPLDRHIATRLENPDAQEERFLHHASTDAELLAIPGIYVLGAGFYAVGRFAHVPWMADVAVHSGEAVFVGTVASEALKGLAGRARPYAVADTNPRDFALGRGIAKGEDFSAFPSVHTVTAFAAASAATAETARRWPHAVWYVGPLLYGGATLVGLSRMYHNQHWASDVAVGAAIGTFSGLKVERWNQLHPNNWVDRLLTDASLSAAPGGGARFGWSFATR